MNIIAFLQEVSFAAIYIKAIEAQNHQIKITTTASGTLKNVLEKQYELMIVEIKDFAKDYQFCRSVKLHRNNIKILAIFIKDFDEKEKMLSCIDDYLVWPVAKDDFLSKIKIFEKYYHADRGEPMVLGDLVIYPEALEVARDGKAIDLRKKEYQLLEFLAHNKNRVVNRHTLLEYIWDYETEAMTNTLDVHMSNLRKKLDRGYATKMLQTVHGTGYKLCDH